MNRMLQSFSTRCQEQRRFGNDWRRLTLALLVMMAASTAAWAQENVSYYDPTAAEGQQQKEATNATRITDATLELGQVGAETWYYVSGETTVYYRIEVMGKVNIILTDGSKFNVSSGIHVPSYYTLNIYAQKAGRGCGKLIGDSSYDACIGGNEGSDGEDLGDDGEDSGNITIYGGYIHVNGNIGGGDGGDALVPQSGLEGAVLLGGNGGGGSVTIYGGDIHVNGNIGGGNGGYGDVGNGSPGNANITLSWTNHTDRIYAEKYYGTVSLLKEFYDDYNQPYSSQNDVEYDDNSTCPWNNRILMSNVIRYSVQIEDYNNIVADKNLAAAGETVYISAVSAYTLTSVSVKDAVDNNVEATANADGTWSFTMPSSMAFVSSEVELKHFAIHCDGLVQLNANSSDILQRDGQTYYRQGATISFTVSSKGIQYVLTSVKVTKNSGDEVGLNLSDNTYSFEMPTEEVTITCSWEQTAYEISYSDDQISLSTDEGNIVNDDNNKYYKPGAVITVAVEPDEGKYVKSLSVKKSDGSTIEVTSISDCTFTFTMPESDVRIDVTYGMLVNFTWTFTDEDSDGQNETLTISGTGDMTNFDEYQYQPWGEIRDEIRTVIIENGITGIGKYAFFDCVNILSVTIPASVTSIGEKAFQSCYRLASVTIPASVTSIGSDAFYVCSGMSDVYCYADPKELDWNEDGCDDFYSADRSTKCHVFDVSAWSDFENIVNVEFVSDLGSSSCPVELTEGDGVNLLTGLAGRSDIPSGTTLNVTFTRTFDETTSGDGKASTICLPYAVNTDPSAGTFYTFGGVSEDGGKYTVTMNAVAAGTTTTAGTPYLFKPACGSAVPFNGQISIADTYTAGAANGEGNNPSAGEWAFLGTFEKKTWPSGQTRLYGFAAADYETADGTRIDATEVGKFRRFGWGICDAFRCYLWAPEPSSARGTNRSASQLPETMRVILVEADGLTTTIGTLDTRTGDVSFDSQAWYSLDGTPLNAQPTKKGMYIHNNKKVIIK